MAAEQEQQTEAPQQLGQLSRYLISSTHLLVRLYSEVRWEWKSYASNRRPTPLPERRRQVCRSEDPFAFRAHQICARELHPFRAAQLSAPGMKGQVRKDSKVRRLLPDYSRLLRNAEVYPEGWLERYRNGWALLGLERIDPNEAATHSTKILDTS